MAPSVPLRDRIVGRLIPAVPVPFEHGVVAEDLHDRYVEWMGRQSIGGIAVWAHTGRGLKLEREQRQYVLNAWRSPLPDVAVICGVGIPEATVLPDDPSVRTAAACRAVEEMSADARAGAADGVLVYPPRALADLPDAEDRILDFHRAACESGLPAVAFYLYEAAGGVSYSPELIERLLDLAGVVGMKIATLGSIMTYQDVSQQVMAAAGVVPITGEDRFLGYSLMGGARSALIGMGAAVTDASAELVGAWFAHDHATFLERSTRIDTFARATFCPPMEGYVQRMLWALEADGVFPRAPVDPWRPELAEQARARVRAAVRALRAP